MRSAESSGVKAKHFGGASRLKRAVADATPGLGAALQRFAARYSPVSIAVAAMAMLGCLLFAGADVFRTLEETDVRSTLVARQVAAELATLPDVESARALLGRVSGTGLSGANFFLTNEEGRLVATSGGALARPVPFDRSGTLGGTIWKEVVIQGHLGSIIVAVEPGAALAPVWRRTFFEVALTLLLVAAVLRPKRAGGDNLSRAEQTRMSQLIETMPFGVACWSKAGQLLVCNGAYRQLALASGISADQGTSYGSFIKHMSVGGYMRMVEDGGDVRLAELHRPDGGCMLIDERRLEQTGFVTLLTDVTSQKRTDVLLTSIREEQKLLARRYHEEKVRAEAASRSKTSFLAHLSHEIRTPLNHIIGFADLIRQQAYGPLGDARYLSYIDDIKGSGERLLTSFAEILEMAELDSGSKVLRRETIAIADLLHATGQRFAAQAERAGIALNISEAPATIVIGDRHCLQRMLSNLVENAMRFTPRGGKITLAAWPAEDGVVLEVSDTGIGIPEEKLHQLSQPFVLGDAAFSRDHSGVGLGISISRAIAELSGGRLAIDSSPAIGTTIAISLPTGAEQRSEAAEAA